MNGGCNRASNAQTGVRFEWLSGTVLDADFNPVSPASYTLSSDSGTNWVASQAVQEP